MDNIKTRMCGYNCGTKIYWNKEENVYVELMSKKKHVCPNRNKSNQNQSSGTNTNTKPYYKKEWTNKYSNQSNVEKPKMSNSFEHITGSPRSIREEYQFLSQLIRDVGGKVHGSQRGTDRERELDMVVYYEVPEIKLGEVQEKFNNYLREHE